MNPTLVAVAVLLPSGFRIPWHMGNFGNAVVGRLCTSKGQHMFCWEPHFWTKPGVIDSKGRMGPRKVTGEYSDFWAANGPSMRSIIPPIPGPDEGEALPDLAIHLRCGDVSIGDDLRIYRYPCRSCIKESESWLKEGWNNATSTSWLVIGGHRKHGATKEELDEANRRCNDCKCLI